MATATRPLTTLALNCPFCGESEPYLEMSLKNLETIKCVECDREFSPAEAIAHLEVQAKRWAGVQAWLESAGSFLAAAK